MLVHDDHSSCALVSQRLFGSTVNDEAVLGADSVALTTGKELEQDVQGVRTHQLIFSCTCPDSGVVHVQNSGWVRSYLSKNHCIYHIHHLEILWPFQI